MAEIFSIADIDMQLEQLTLDKLLDTKLKFEYENPTIAKEIKVAPNVFKRLNRYFIDEQAEREREGIKAMPKEDVWITGIYGVKITVDPDMRPGTWKFI